MTFDDVRAIALNLPEVAETTSYGTPSFKVRKQMLCRLRDDGATLVIRVDPLEREALLAEPGGAYFITPHYQDYPYVLVELESADPNEVRELLIEVVNHDGGGTRLLTTEREADDAAYRARMEGRRLGIYQCSICGGWHLTSRGAKD